MYSDREDYSIAPDKRFLNDETDSVYKNYLFTRMSAKGKVFKRIDFSYSTFDACYLRDAKFDSCKFIGCRFISTNLSGAIFSGCEFDYATFERTTVEPTILDTECPKRENLRERFARTLRMNYQQLGDAAAVNKAMRVELEASRTHFYKCWASQEAYYRKKYTGRLWFRAFWRWTGYAIVDLVWGNGESAPRLLRFVLLILGLMTLFQAFSYGNPTLVATYWTSLLTAGEVFMGVSPPPGYPGPYVAAATLCRFIAVGLLLSILIKRFNRR